MSKKSGSSRAVERSGAEPAIAPPPQQVECSCRIDENGNQFYCPEHASPALPDRLWGFALEQREGKFLACRISTAGDREYIGPKLQTGEPRPESKHLALMRMFEALKSAYVPSSTLRLG